MLSLVVHLDMKVSIIAEQIYNAGHVFSFSVMIVIFISRMQHERKQFNIIINKPITKMEQPIFPFL